MKYDNWVGTLEWLDLSQMKFLWQDMEEEDLSANYNDVASYCTFDWLEDSKGQEVSTTN